jgi:hypothetical protein
MSDLSDRIRKTFDDDYGRHALVIAEDEFEPSFGRVDVILVLEKNGGPRLHPSRVAPGYKPTHVRAFALPFLLSC